MAKKMLIIYYSFTSDNTKRIAEELQKATGADIARLYTSREYTGSYDDIVDQGLKEVNEGYMPEILPIEFSLDDYDIIAIGSPTWWYTMAPAVLTFLSNNDMAGKTVIPFQTHGGWPGHFMKDIKNICKGADIENEISIQFNNDKIVTDKSEVKHWIQKLETKNT